MGILVAPLRQSLIKQLILGKKMNEITSNNQTEINLYEGMPKIDHGTVKVVNYIFERLAGIIPSMDKSSENDLALASRKREYTYALMSNNIKNMGSINKALDKIRRDGLKFIPTPCDFIKYCQIEPEDIGAPDLETAYGEACLQAHPQSWKKDWSHTAVHHAYKRTGSAQFLTGKAEITFNKFSANYLQACLDFAAGRIVDQIEHKKPLSSSDIDRPYMYGKYEMIRPGVMKIYENVRTAEECFAICDKLLGKGTGRLKALIDKLERQQGIGNEPS
jgi:hypothetical protein